MFLTFIYWLALCCVPILTVVIVLGVRDMVKIQREIKEQNGRILEMLVHLSRKD